MAFKKAGKEGYGKKSYGGAGKSYGGRDRDSGSGSYGKKPFGGAGRSFGGARGSTGGGLELFDVTCAQCGTHTQVPFKPTGERPVLCRDCFKGGDSGSRDAPRATPRGNAGGDSSREIREINEKLDKIMRALDIE